MTDEKPSSRPIGVAMLTLALELSPQSAAAGEEVWATAALVNGATIPVLVNGRMALNHRGAPEPYRDVSLEIEGPPDHVHGKRFHVRIGDPEPTDFVLLGPGEARIERYQLTRFFPMDDPGTYVVRAYYANVHGGPRPAQAAWTGSLESNAAVFERTN